MYATPKKRNITQQERNKPLKDSKTWMNVINIRLRGERLISKIYTLYNSIHITLQSNKIAAIENKSADTRGEGRGLGVTIKW